MGSLVALPQYAKMVRLNVLLTVWAYVVALVKSDHDGSSDPLDWLRESVPGEPGVDYPVFAEVSDTSFSCADRIFGGYYADPEMQCQGYHVCLTPPDAGTDRKTSFLCPNGTIFSQALLTCDWWFNVDCSETENLYSINEKLGSDEPLADEGSLANAQPGQKQPLRPSSQPQRGPNQSQSGGGQRGRNKPQGGKGRRRGQGNRKRPQGGQRRPAQNGVGGGQRKAQGNQRGVGSASVQSRGQADPRIQDIEIVQYDATIPDDDDDDVPLLLADPFRDIEEPLALYGTPQR